LNYLIPKDMSKAEDSKEIITFEQCLLLKDEYEKKLKLIEKEHDAEIESLKKRIHMLQQQLQKQ